MCHTCETALLSGTVRHHPEPLEPLADGKILICCAQPSEPVGVTAECRILPVKCAIGIPTNIPDPFDDTGVRWSQVQILSARPREPAPASVGAGLAVPEGNDMWPAVISIE